MAWVEAQVCTAEHLHFIFLSVFAQLRPSWSPAVQHTWSLCALQHLCTSRICEVCSIVQIRGLGEILIGQLLSICLAARLCSAS